MDVAVRSYVLKLHKKRIAPLKIALVADLHACTPFMTIEHINAIIAQTNAFGADMVALLGDYAGHVFGGRNLSPTNVADCLSDLAAPLGVFAVFGNHDWRDDREAQEKKGPTKWHKAFEKAGIAHLSNLAINLDWCGDKLVLAGLDSQLAYQTFWDRRRRGADDFAAIEHEMSDATVNLLLAHEPDIFPELPSSVDVTLAGHTHGGQIAPFGQALVVPSRYGRRYAYGHFAEGSKHLVVSGGLGYSGVPIRLGRPPELVLVEVS